MSSEGGVGRLCGRKGSIRKGENEIKKCARTMKLRLILGRVVDDTWRGEGIDPHSIPDPNSGIRAIKRV